MPEYSSKPSQFRLPAWAQEFLVQESAATGATKTDVVLEALDQYKRRQLERRLAEGYRECASADLEEIRAWDGTLLDGLEVEGVVAGVKRGDVHFVDLDPVVGSEQGGRRPVVVVQNDIGNEFSGTTIIAVITSRRIRPFPFIVALPDGTLPRPSVVNCAQVRTVDKARLTSEPIASLDSATMRRLDEALRISLGLY